jgi:hypothetical protein
MRRVVRILGLFTAVAISDACGAARSTRPSDAPRTILEVDNQSFADMTMYIVNGGHRVRLGRAAGKTKTQLTIPPTIVGRARELQFLADPLAGDRPAVSNRIWVDAGDRVTMIITP